MPLTTKLKKTFFFAAIAILFTINTQAQIDSAKDLPNFLLPSFTKSIIKFKAGDSKTAHINYNVIDQEMVFMQGDTYMVLDNPLLIDTVYIGTRQFVPFATGFYEVLMTGPLSLFIQHKSNAEPVGTAGGYGTTSQTSAATYQRQMYGPTGSVNLKIPDDFKITDDTYYWIKKGSVMEKFANKRQFLKIFKDKEKELSKFISVNDIQFNKNDDLIKLATYWSSLYN